MRKVTIGLVLVVAFAVGAFIGLEAPAAQAKTRCWTTCAGGELMECCRINGIVLCRLLVQSC